MNGNVVTRVIVSLDVLEEDLGIPVLDPVMCEGLMALFQLLRRKK